MAVKTTLSKEDRNELTKDVNDLDKVYLEKMKKEGVDPSLLDQFRELSIEMDRKKNK